MQSYTESCEKMLSSNSSLPCYNIDDIKKNCEDHTLQRLNLQFKWVYEQYIQ